MNKLEPRWIEGKLCYVVPVTLAADTSILLRRISGRRGDSFSETMRRGLAALDFIENEVAQGKQLVVIEPGRGRTIRAQEIHLVDVPAGKPQSTGPRQRGRLFRRFRRNPPNQKENTDAHDH
ncbi:hypothetical protein OG394_29070 [Kribbella sp. NBC_01245]|uniref:hypothetical protein n=1 Tax=Kribbella sp. NBC_01245 TaxID=2903578 RepID=UPI002E2D5F35|nr:hypothetical protein [Kribbella sp. NBC_01245]